MSQYNLNDLGKQHINFVRQEGIKLKVKFARNTTETVDCLAHGDLPAIIEVEETRDVKYTRV